MSIVAANIENLILQLKSRGFNFSYMGKKCLIHWKSWQDQM